MQLLSSGADGLVKLWNVRSTECLNTFDGHEDKVWAMTVGGVQEGLVATGGGDARVQIWEDCTLQDKAEAAEEEEVTLLKQQRLSNALQVIGSLSRFFLLTQTHGFYQKVYLWLAGPGSHSKCTCTTVALLCPSGNSVSGHSTHTACVCCISLMTQMQHVDVSWKKIVGEMWSVCQSVCQVETSGSALQFKDCTSTAPRRFSYAQVIESLSVR